MKVWVTYFSVLNWVYTVVDPVFRKFQEAPSACRSLMMHIVILWWPSDFTVE
jgi:hypothetical protein